MDKRGLIIGIDHYDNYPALSGCVADAKAIAPLLQRHGDEAKAANYSCKVFTSDGADRITRPFLRSWWNKLFSSFTGEAAFYFAGHGARDLGGYIVTQEGELDDPGLPMNDLVELANQSRAHSVLIILDCCYSGAAGNARGGQPTGLERATLREGVTILAASRPTETTREVDGHGVFTDLVLGALDGGAADVRGHVSAAGIYGYVESALGSWAPPIYKSHGTRMEPVRRCAPKVSDALLRELPDLFPTADAGYPLDTTYEEDNQVDSDPAHVAIFRKFKELQLAGLLMPEEGADLYWTAQRSEEVALTALGQFYWRIAKKGDSI